jgi:hypothetical protein
LAPGHVVAFSVQLNGIALFGQNQTIHFEAKRKHRSPLQTFVPVTSNDANIAAPIGDSL